MSDKSYWMAEAIALQAKAEEDRKEIHRLKSFAIDLKWEIDRLRELVKAYEDEKARLALRERQHQSIEGNQ